MKSRAGILRNILCVIYLVAVHTLAALFVYENYIQNYFAAENIQPERVADPTETVAVPTPQPIPSFAGYSTPEEMIPDTNQSQTKTISNELDNANLAIPVTGIKPEQLQDTYSDARSEGCVHNAIDIIAPPGTPVIAVSDGEIAKFFDSERGGITIYQYSPDKRFVYYYAHLQKRADNLKEKDFVKKGTVIGFVGDTGNSGAGNYHLHFSIALLSDPKRIFDGIEINPYPILKKGSETR
ncbi:MAG TPA: M23 family metallopeptidase [Pyrinomonadaceae bacterium]|nr:M23 family metallopeptidase [Pyrinomonadaceae bacterium]